MICLHSKIFWRVKKNKRRGAVNRGSQIRRIIKIFITIRPLRCMHYKVMNALFVYKHNSRAEDIF